MRLQMSFFPDKNFNVLCICLQGDSKDNMKTYSKDQGQIVSMLIWTGHILIMQPGIWERINTFGHELFDDPKHGTMELVC